MALALTTGAIGVIGALGFMISVSRGPVSLAITVTAPYPALSVLLAMVFLQDGVSLKQAIGIMLALVAMGLVAT